MRGAERRAEGIAEGRWQARWERGQAASGAAADSFQGGEFLRRGRGWRGSLEKAEERWQEGGVKGWEGGGGRGPACLVGQRGEQKGMLRDPASLRECSKGVRGAPADR